MVTNDIAALAAEILRLDEDALHAADALVAAYDRAKEEP